MAVFVALIMGLLGGAAAVLVLYIDRYRRLFRLRQRVAAAVTRNEQRDRDLRNRDLRLTEAESKLSKDISAFNARVVSYTELQGENAILKRDLRNVELSQRKARLDAEVLRQRQDGLDERSTSFAQRWLKDSLKWIDRQLSPDNYVLCKQRLTDVIAWCRDIGFDVSPEEEARLLGDLRASYELEVRRVAEREAQAQIRAQIREEQRVERERQRELVEAETQRQVLQAQLDRALENVAEQHQAEIEALRKSLAEAEARAQRAISMAQLTRAGHVYVLSNLGSFGDGVYKVGMTRRLEPQDRVKELGGASVPFPFDVHMMIRCEDAPTLEKDLHHALHRYRVNPINPRKEFFRTTLDQIRTAVEEHHGVVEYVADAEALQYRQSLEISPEDREFIEQVYESLPEEADEAGEFED